MPHPTLDFWFDFASTYSWLSAIRIEALAAEAKCRINWRPFLLGPIFKAQGWTSSPFNLYPAKGRYMVRDITRIATARGRKFQMPAAFPANSLAAARVAIAVGELHVAAFTRNLFAAEFETGADIADRATIEAVLTTLGLDAAAIQGLCETAAIKDALRTNTERAAALGIFGAPTFITPDGELFWGDDRLEQALAWATRGKA